MGTVPDPTRSAKTSPTSAEELCPACDTSITAIPQLKQATSASNGNATHIPSVYSPDLNCNPDTKHSDNQTIYELETEESKKAMSLLRTCSQSETVPLQSVEHLTMQETQTLKTPIQDASATTSTVQTTTITLSPHITPLILPSENLMTEQSNWPKDRTVVEIARDDKVISTSTSALLPEMPPNMDADKLDNNKNAHMPSDNQESITENVPPGKTLNSDPITEEEAKLEDLKHILSSEKCSQFSLAEELLNTNGEHDTMELNANCKFKEMGTMTSQLEGWLMQDAEVQAVANVENKSVSTSPSILAAFLKANSPGLKERQEQLCIIYQGNPGNPQIERANFALHSQFSQNHLTPKVCFQPPDTKGPQPLQMHNKSPPDMIRSPFQHPEIARSTQLLYRNELDGQGLCHPKTQMQMSNASPILMNVKPVYQINIENSPQTKANQRTKDMFSEQAQLRTAHEMASKARIHRLSEVENIQLHNLRQDCEQSDTLTVPGESTSERKPFHFKITNEQGSTQAIITTDIKKPKKEERPTPLHVEVEVNSSIGATGGQVEEILEVLVRKDKDNGEYARRSSSLNLQTRPASDFNQSSVQLTPRLRKAREEKKEPLLVSLPTSEPSKSHGKKSSPGSSTEAKSQAKQASKSVKDVVWDEQGMTWEVYGASMDPEALGIAIQNHLQRQIREHEKMIRAQLKQNRKSICSDTSGKKHKRRQHRVFQSILKNFRRPNCCSHPPPSAVIE